MCALQVAKWRGGASRGTATVRGLAFGGWEIGGGSVDREDGELGRGQ
jgi:hypothetical protein